MGEVSVLLDSHTLLWWLDDDKRLSRRARTTIAAHRTTVFVSAASVWEIAIKVELGKLRDPTDAVRHFPMLLAERGLTDLHITAAHAVAAAALPRIHRDPFDRMLVAQAIVEGVPIVTDNPLLPKYGIEVIW